MKMNSEDSSYSAKNLQPISLHVINKDDDFAGFTLRVCHVTIDDNVEHLELFELFSLNCDLWVIDRLFL